jgi:hypothetical protein
MAPPSRRSGASQWAHAKVPDFKLALTRVIEPTARPGVELATLKDAAKFVGAIRPWRQAYPHWGYAICLPHAVRAECESRISRCLRIATPRNDNEADENRTRDIESRRYDKQPDQTQPDEDAHQHRQHDTRPRC